MTITRRAMIQALALASALPAVARASEPGDSPLVNAGDAIDALVSAWMKEHNAPALSLAFARPDRMRLARAWGVAQWGGEAATTDTLFRIASVSKPITAVAIFLLIERGFLQLDDVVFGSNGLLKGEFGADLPDNLNAITIRHLLMHLSGGWPNDGRDPTLRHPEMERREWLEWTLRRQPLQWEPGRHYAYSNVGYCILGEIISHLTAQSYAEFVEENIFAPCNVKRMRLATNERLPGEVRYYDGEGGDPYGRNMERIAAPAGWLGTPTDLARFVAKSPALLRPETLKTMTTPGEINPLYACGWSANARGTIWHTGGLPGSNSFIVRTSSGLSWAALTNTNGKESLKSLNELMWKIAGMAGT